MNPETAATLGDPEFPPKHGVIIKQGQLFIQETKRILFMKWKVWRKRWITLRYEAKSSSPVLQIDSRTPMALTHLLLHLTCDTSVQMIDSSGPQDLATAKVLELRLDDRSDPVVFKHPSLDEMSDWLAAFRLTVALGETGSICSDTDSSTWTNSVTAGSPVESSHSSPNGSFGYDGPASYVIRIAECSASGKMGLLIDRDYELAVSQQGLMLFDKTPDEQGKRIMHWPLHFLRKVYMENATSGCDVIVVEATRQLTTGDGLLNIRSTKADDLLQRLRTLMTSGSNLKKVLTEQQEAPSLRSSKRRPMTDRPRKRPPLGLIGGHNRMSTEQQSPKLSKPPSLSLSSRENSLRTCTAMKFKGMPHMDSRESTNSSEYLPDVGLGISNKTPFTTNGEQSDEAKEFVLTKTSSS